MELRKYDKILAIAKRRGFLWPSSEIYGGLAGFFDYGPMGSLLKHNIEQAWRRLFVIQEGMFEIETPSIMPKQVFQGSGHLEHFKDAVVECKKCKAHYKVDQLKEKGKCPKCSGKLPEPFMFDLMFKTEVGPAKEKAESFLRPETAQGMFVAFPRLFEVARKKIPFGVCQIGPAYRNEISPRQGMIRLREFSQAEAEIFYNPQNKKHPKFEAVKNHKLPLYTKENQKKGKEEYLETSAGEAVKKGIINSELQAYYLALSEKFFEDLGIPKKAIRCRQQLDDERAHYSVETWDVEVKSEDFGWIEVCAVADRTDYDLKGHAKVSKQDLSVNIEGDKFVPNVMEASFGVDRPVYCVLEHSYREDGKRTYIAIDKKIAPLHACVFPLVNKDKLPEKAKEVYLSLVKAGLMVQYDDKGSIGRMYARADEIGVPVCITIDYDTLKDNTVTVRERDSTKQERVKIEKLAETF